jgi:hypothetical protein
MHGQAGLKERSKENQACLPKRQRRQAKTIAGALCCNARIFRMKTSLLIFTCN